MLGPDSDVLLNLIVKLVLHDFLFLKSVATCSYCIKAYSGKTMEYISSQLKVRLH